MADEVFQQDQIDMLSALLDGDVEFLLVGGLALAAYGHSRATKDMDLWVRCTPDNIQRAWRAWPNSAHLSMI